MSDELLLRIVTDPDVIADPYPLLRELRTTSPVHKTGFADFWILTRFEDCRTALRDQRLGHAEPGEEAPSLLAPSRGPRPDRPRLLIFLNPPDHTRIRSLVSRAFTPRRVERLRPAVEAMAHELLDRVAEMGQCDVIDSLAFPLPANVISELVGVPVADRDWLRTIVSDLSANLEPNRQPDEEERAAEAGAQLQEYLDDLIDRRRARLTDDLLSGLIEASDGADRLSQQEVMMTVSLIYAAGFETTMNLIGNIVHTLTRHPDQLTRLRADRSLVPSAVDEVLRYESPVQIDGRYVRADTEIGGHRIPRGHGVLALLGAANRDPAVVDDPERFDVGRDNVPMLSFGSGIHYCLGAALARLEGQVVLGALLDRFKTWSLLDDNPPWKRRLTLRGLQSLPVAFF